MKNPSGSLWEKRPNLIFLSLLTLLIFVFYRQVIFGDSIFVFVDASRFFYPLWKWGAGVLSQGIIPLWNTDAQFGTPYFADPQMAYAYPPVPVFYSFLSPTNAFASLIILHHLWALLGFWFFARWEGFSAKASFFGSLAFGFSLHLVCSSWTPVALMTISWLPWVFAAAGKVFRGERGGLLYLSLAWAMQLSAGYPVLVYLTGWALLIHFGWKSYGRGPWALRWLGWFALAGAMAAAYNLVWGLPFAEFLGQSNYENGAGKFHDLTWLDLGTALSPFLQGHPLLPDYHGPHYWVSTYYIGLPLLCLLLWGALRRVYRRTSPVIFLLFLVLSLGVLGAGKILKVLLPGYSLVVHSGFWISILLFFAVWMAMESLESFLISPPPDSGRWFWTGSVIVVYAASFFVHSSLYPGCFWASFALLIGAAFLKPDSLKWGCVGLALILSLGSAADSLNILLDKGYYEKPPVVLANLSKPGRFFFTPPLMGEAGKLQGASMSQAYESAKQKLYPNWPLAFGREQAPLYNTIQLKSSFAWTFQAFQHSLRHSREALDLLNIRYLFGRNQFKDLKKIEGAVEDGNVSENPSPLPKWFTVEKALAAGDSVEDDFSKADQEAVDYRKAAFIADASKAGRYQPRSVLESARKTNEVALDAGGIGKALLASSETNYPGWKVWVEGVQRPVETINHAFRGVVLNNGEAKVRFLFLPASFRLGLFTALLVIGIWTCLLAQRIKA